MVRPAKFLSCANIRGLISLRYRAVYLSSSDSDPYRTSVCLTRRGGRAVECGGLEKLAPHDPLPSVSIDVRSKTLISRAFLSAHEHWRTASNEGGWHQNGTRGLSGSGFPRDLIGDYSERSPIPWRTHAFASAARRTAATSGRPSSR